MLTAWSTRGFKAATRLSSGSGICRSHQRRHVMPWCTNLWLRWTNPNGVGEEFTHGAYNASGLISGSDGNWNCAPWSKVAMRLARRLHIVHLLCVGRYSTRTACHFVLPVPSMNDKCFIPSNGAFHDVPLHNCATPFVSTHADTYLAHVTCLESSGNAILSRFHTSVDPGVGFTAARIHCLLGCDCASPFHFS